MSLSEKDTLLEFSKADEEVTETEEREASKDSDGLVEVKDEFCAVTMVAAEDTELAVKEGPNGTVEEETVSVAKESGLSATEETEASETIESEDSGTEDFEVALRKRTEVSVEEDSEPAVKGETVASV